MGYLFKVDDKKRILNLIYEGEVDYKVRLYTTERARKYLEEKWLKKLLIDSTRCIFSMSTKENFDFAFHVNEFENDVKIAFLIKEFDINTEFLIRLLFNRGFVVNTFTVKSEALEWLH